MNLSPNMLNALNDAVRAEVEVLQTGVYVAPEVHKSTARALYHRGFTLAPWEVRLTSKAFALPVVREHLQRFSDQLYFVVKQAEANVPGTAPSTPQQALILAALRLRARDAQRLRYALETLLRATAP